MPWTALRWLTACTGGLGTLALESVVCYHGVRQVKGHVAGVFMAVMLISALVLSYVLLDEAPRWWHGTAWPLWWPPRDP